MKHKCNMFNSKLNVIATKDVGYLSVVKKKVDRIYNYGNIKFTN